MAEHEAAGVARAARRRVEWYAKKRLQKSQMAACTVDYPDYSKVYLISRDRPTKNVDDPTRTARE